MKFEKEITLRPLISGYSSFSVNKDKPYYEQVLLIEDDYPFAMVHVDMFWPGSRNITPEDKYSIYDPLNKGEQIKVKVTFELIEDEGDN